MEFVTTSTILEEHLDFCATIAEIAQEKIVRRSAEIDERPRPHGTSGSWPSRTSWSAVRHRVRRHHTGTSMLNMAVEVIAKVDAACALILWGRSLGRCRAAVGTDELKERFLPSARARSGRRARALGAEAGSDPRCNEHQSGSATRWMMDGTKNWNHGLGMADFYICSWSPTARAGG